AQEISPIRRLMAVTEIDYCPHMIGERCDERREDRRDHDRRDHQRADDSGGISREAVPRHIARRKRLRLLRQDGRHHRASLKRSLGSMTRSTMSMIRLATMKKNPETSTTAMTALRSFCRIASSP